MFSAKNLYNPLYSVSMPRRKGKTLKQVILEVLEAGPKTLDELVAEVKRKKPRTKPRVIKALITKMKKAGELKETPDGKIAKA